MDPGPVALMRAKLGTFAGSYQPVGATMASLKESLPLKLPAYAVSLL